MLELSYSLLSLPLEFPFRIAWGQTTTAETVWVRLHWKEAPELEGWGEAVPSLYYGEDSTSVTHFYAGLLSQPWFQRLDPFDLQKLEEQFAQIPGNLAAKAGVEMALHDLWGKCLGEPLYRLWGLQKETVPPTCYTIGLGNEAETEQKVALALERGYTHLKVKLGADLETDLQQIRRVRSLAPKATLQADANAGWDYPQACILLEELAELDYQFVEEPLKLEEPWQQQVQLKAQSPLPLMADERCKTLLDVARCAEGFHAINLKHTKTGGLREAIRMVHAARAHSLKVMVGGFTESSLSVTAMGHLAPLADYADLDACLLIKEDPFLGLQYDGSQVTLPSLPGLGVTLRNTPINEASEC